jgi:hypothetical protein
MGSGIGIGVIFGSIVQKGKFFARANDFCAIALTDASWFVRSKQIGNWKPQ